jgi:hypothetical protein
VRDLRDALRPGCARVSFGEPPRDERLCRLAVNAHHGVARAQARALGLRAVLDIGDDHFALKLAHRDADRDVTLHAPVVALARLEDARVWVAECGKHPAQHRVQLALARSLSRARAQRAAHLLPVNAA